ncbi:MAG: hypothetical protein JXA95_04625 [Spirochaetales bacterium]|nr:hypothetical protein [Spirochaetales bacterium]
MVSTDVMTLAEILFLLGFSLHNLEEGLWLPRWSRGAAKYHKSIGEGASQI